MKVFISVENGMKAGVGSSGSESPLGTAEWSPQDFTLFLINYCHNLSANVGERAALDNTCGEETLLTAVSHGVTKY